MVPGSREVMSLRKLSLILLVGALILGGQAWAKGPLNLAIIWHQHQPLYWSRLAGEYELPWVRVHGVQEYIDSSNILMEFPGVHVTYNLQPSLLWQLLDYVEITEEERAKGGLYQYIGAVDNHLKWIWKLIADPRSLTPEERAKMQEQFFWINGYMFDDDSNDPYYDMRYASLNAMKNARPLTDQELLDAAGLFLLWQISPELHEALGIADLRGKAGFTKDDIVRLIQAQHAVLSQVVDAYRSALANGSELITSPFYHPILPLLAERGWDEDVQGQLSMAQRQHEGLFGEPATGVWPPEQAVSERAVALLAEAGFSWTVTNDGILAQALGHTPSRAELTTPYTFDGITVLFRDHGLSDKIGFSYGNKPTQVAVVDFMEELRRYWEALPAPEEHLLVVALDGENWMFMAGYPNNGRNFLRALYRALSEANWVRTVTPAEFLAEHPATTGLADIPTGSWGGDLSTWAGEPEEDEAWARLAAAREAVFSAGPPEAALGALYAAEGSDWFWWYGTDQDSGTDDLFDWLFKVHLVAAYRAAGVPEDRIPQALFLRLVIPTVESLGEVSPTPDGVIGPDEWDQATHYSGEGALRGVWIGYSENTLYVAARLDRPARDLVGEELVLALYASGKPGSPANIVTHHAGVQLGFTLASSVELNFAKLRQDGAGYVFRYDATPSGGWRLASPIRTLLFRKAKADEVVEFQLPFEELGIEPGKSIILALALEGPGALLGQLPARPLLAKVPQLVKGVQIFVMGDPAGDDHGPGGYVYPTNNVFSVPGIFDLVRYAVYDADDSWQLVFDFKALPNPWNGPQGFSHPLILLFLDLTEGGRTDLHKEAEAAQVAFDPEHPWDVFIRIAGWPAYGRHLWTADGRGPYLVGVAADPKRNRVLVSIPKEIVPEIRGWHYVLIASQDGYGKDYVRAIGNTPGEWTGGGCADPMWAPQIYDYLAPEGTSQEEVLAAYDPAMGEYPVLSPVEVR